ncbi:MAG: alanyl-tRNA editing protein, partial [Oscillospiraceae bacterium]|nr:alanyl-tRNA editing protein [Oscillospiraceae bacterium]
METEKLYYHDPYLTTFTATVLSCEAAKGGYTVVLDRTAFYPEGGGQPADHGTLGGAAVTDVHEKGGVILHTCASPVEIGAEVTGEIDWERRFDHMQQHSGEHIISGILCADYACDNVGFHMGADTVTIDYNTDISWEQALAAEAKANAAIYADTPVVIEYPSPAELEALDYRSKKELTGQVRIVTFPEADCCACCGTHVATAGQVGLIKVLSVQKFREGVRMEILCGKRALAYLSAVYDAARATGQRLSVKPTDTFAA